MYDTLAQNEIEKKKILYRPTKKTTVIDEDLPSSRRVESINLNNLKTTEI